RLVRRLVLREPHIPVRPEGPAGAELFGELGEQLRHRPGDLLVVDRLVRQPVRLAVVGREPFEEFQCLARPAPESHPGGLGGGSLCECETSMADADDVRRLALALPQVVEIDSDGFDFRVADKGFVWSYPERRPGKPRLIRTDIAVLYVGDEAEK